MRRASVVLRRHLIPELGNLSSLVLEYVAEWENPRYEILIIRSFSSKLKEVRFEFRRLSFVCIDDQMLLPQERLS